MARHHLNNARWGFDSNCLVCEPSNRAGLGIAFVHDDEMGSVEVELCLDKGFTGGPNYVHGGLGGGVAAGYLRSPLHEKLRD